MTDAEHPYDTSPFQNAYYKFLDTQERLLRAKFGDRPLDQYFEFRDATLTYLRSEGFREEFNRGLADLTCNSDYGFYRNDQIIDLLRLELEATTRAADITLNLKGKKKISGFRKMFSRGSTANGSVKDLFDKLLDMYPLLKGGLIIFGELLDIFKEE